VENPCGALFCALLRAGQPVEKGSGFSRLSTAGVFSTGGVLIILLILWKTSVFCFSPAGGVTFSAAKKSPKSRLNLRFKTPFLSYCPFAL
jgi:hypothetical protein